MFAGHIGAAQAIGRAERRINVGVFVVAAVLLDGVLWLLVLLGWESVSIPADFARTHQPEFAFPLSQGLAASALWSGLAAGVAGLLLFVRGSTLSRGKSLALAALTLVVLTFTVAGMTIAPAPPSAAAMAASSLATLVAVCTLACWLGRPAREGPT